MTDINGSKTSVAMIAGGLITGMNKRFTNGAQSLTFGGGAVNTTVTAAIANLQAIVDNRAAVTTAQAAAKAKVAQEDAQMPALLAFLRELEAFIRLNFGADATALADFALTPPKARTPMTTEQKAVATAKAAATRKVRGASKTATGNVQATLVVTPAPAAATAPAKA
jgi:hypothetical protein